MLLLLLIQVQLRDRIGDDRFVLLPRLLLLLLLLLFLFFQCLANLLGLVLLEFECGRVAVRVLGSVVQSVVLLNFLDLLVGGQFFHVLLIVHLCFLLKELLLLFPDVDLVRKHLRQLLLGELEQLFRELLNRLLVQVLDYVVFRFRLDVRQLFDLLLRALVEVLAGELALDFYEAVLAACGRVRPVLAKAEGS